MTSARAARSIPLLALVNGLTVANLYYCQPLMPRIAASYGGSPLVGNLVATGQAGYALGLVLVVPLGDIVRRRPLACTLLLTQAAALLATAAAPGLPALLAAGLVLGLATSSVLQTLLPYAAGIAPERERGRAVGTMLTGSLAGVMLSRTVAGLAAEIAGWRAVFVAAAVVTVLLAVVLARAMESVPAEVELGYRAQLRATARLALAEPVLRRRALIGACVFACFTLFWATAPFLLAGPPYRYGDAEIGLIALVGAAGALAARPLGRVADRGSERPLTGGLLLLGLVSFVPLWAGATTLSWLIAGIVLLDVAVSGVHLLNLSVVYGPPGGARARIASVYMTAYTLGGVTGAAVGTAVYQHGGWGAVQACGAAFMAMGLAVWARDTGVPVPPQAPVARPRTRRR
ncbi:MFS transporter [Actinomadura fibrosa]|uniref:MFS transporter n=1 Tax=Actinomadura fibrosa TaxID=111802 RepID=A0ABW2XSG4_9ACTN|nr:MFS transporter [Actinomadura fibrosa]